MEEELYLSSLYDYYKNLLTDKQKNTFEDYYYDNLSLSEIAENNNTSRASVSKQLQIIKDKLYEYEKKLNLEKNKKTIENILGEETSKKIEDYI